VEEGPDLVASREWATEGGELVPTEARNGDQEP
jgi:hypothetical protein